MQWLGKVLTDLLCDVPSKIGEDLSRCFLNSLPHSSPYYFTYLPPLIGPGPIYNRHDVGLGPERTYAGHYQGQTVGGGGKIGKVIKQKKLKYR